MPSYPLPAAVHALFGTTDPQRTAANLKAAQVVDECDMPALAAAQRRAAPARNNVQRRPAMAGAMQ